MMVSDDINAMMTSKKKSYEDSINADILIAYPSFMGFKSYRHPKDGTWFIQTLTSELEKNNKQKEIITLLTIVNRKVGEKFIEKQKEKRCFELPKGCLGEILEALEGVLEGLEGVLKTSWGSWRLLGASWRPR